MNRRELFRRLAIAPIAAAAAPLLVDKLPALELSVGGFVDRGGLVEISELSFVRAWRTSPAMTAALMPPLDQRVVAELTRWHADQVEREILRSLAVPAEILQHPHCRCSIAGLES